MTDAITLLRELRPETSDDPPGEATLERLLRSGPEPRLRRRRRRRALIAVPVAAAALLLAISLAVDPSSEGGGLVAKAFAATSSGDEIVHEVAVRTWAEKNQTETRETWWRESDGAARSVTTNPGGVTTALVDASGVVRLGSPYLAPEDEIDSNGMTVMADPTTDPSGYVARAMRGVTSVFRESYRTEDLRDDGMTTFDGRAVHAYSYNGWLTFYIDPDTAQLAGMREAGTKSSEETVTTVIETYERLPATTENIAKLG